MTQLFVNPTFHLWPHGSPRDGAWGLGAETAEKWISKWNKSQKSHATAADLTPPLTGLLYRLIPFDGVYEAFYMRQTVGNLRARLDKTYQISTVARRITTAPILLGWYVNARWNVNQRLLVLNTHPGGDVPMSPSFRKYQWEFTMPTGQGISWELDHSQGIEAAVIFNTRTPGRVSIRSMSIVEV